MVTNAKKFQHILVTKIDERIKSLNHLLCYLLMVTKILTNGNKR